jgi:hypothetical protein
MEMECAFESSCDFRGSVSLTFVSVEPPGSNGLFTAQAPGEEKIWADTAATLKD